jgi:hypothetical protein
MTMTDATNETLMDRMVAGRMTDFDKQALTIVDSFPVWSNVAWRGGFIGAQYPVADAISNALESCERETREQCSRDAIWEAKNIKKNRVRRKRRQAKMNGRSGGKFAVNPKRKGARTESSRP